MPPTAPLHEDEITIPTALATRLIDAQFPKLAGRPVRPLSATGTDNAMFRLGGDLLLRFPRRPSANLLIRREWEWLPYMQNLPLAVPEPVEMGEPALGYPSPWMILKWIPGDPARLTPLGGSEAAAETLAHFARALRDLPGDGGPIAGSANHNRGAPLATLDDTVRQSIAALPKGHHPDDLAALWDAALAAPEWSGAPLWLHGDLSEGNLLTFDGRLGAVIDFGLMARGDPAVDLIPAWSLFKGPARARFLDAAHLDDATEARGRGWALYTAVIDLACYGDGHAALARQARRTLDALLDG
ncbi:MAG: aminoglycoside phosphotransferase family protein [Marinibacterium sp.]